MDVHARLSAITGCASSAQPQAYRVLTDELVAAQHCDLAQTLFDHLISSSSSGGGVEMLVVRPALAYLCEEVKGIKSQPELKSFCVYGLDKVRARSGGWFLWLQR